MNEPGYILLVVFSPSCWGPCSLFFLSLHSLSLSLSAPQPLRLDIKRRLTARSDRVKSVDLHPTEPWMVVSLYSGAVVVWNHDTQVGVTSLSHTLICPLNPFQWSLIKSFISTQSLQLVHTHVLWWDTVFKACIMLTGVYFWLVCRRWWKPSSCVICRSEWPGL